MKMVQRYIAMGIKAQEFVVNRKDFYEKKAKIKSKMYTKWDFD